MSLDPSVNMKVSAVPIMKQPQWHMIHSHASLKLGFESIEKHLANPPKDDLPNFLGYCESWVAILEHHHDGEEATVFPVLNTKMDFSGEQEAHKHIHAFLEKFEEVLKKAKEDPASFDAEATLQLLAGAKENLYSHLDAEIEHLDEAKLREAGFTEKEIKDMLSSLESYAIKGVVMARDLPFMWSHTPIEARGVFPPFPWIVSKVILPWFLTSKHRGWWKYSPYPC